MLNMITYSTLTRFIIKNCFKSGEEYSPRIVDTSEEFSDNEGEGGTSEIPEYELGARKAPPLYKDYEDDLSHDLLDDCFRKDIA